MRILWSLGIIGIETKCCDIVLIRWIQNLLSFNLFWDFLLKSKSVFLFKKFSANILLPLLVVGWDCCYCCLSSYVDRCLERCRKQSHCHCQWSIIAMVFYGIKETLHQFRQSACNYLWLEKRKQAVRHFMMTHII